MITWVLTWVMNFRPLTLPSCIDRFARSPILAFEHNYNWQRAIRVTKSVLSMVTVPIVSAILGQAVVVYIQRQERSSALLV